MKWFTRNRLLGLIRGDSLMLRQWQMWLVVFFSVLFLAGCSNQTPIEVNENVGNTSSGIVDEHIDYETDEKEDNSDETQTKEALLVSSLNIVPYSYDNEFELSRDMEATIEQIVLSYRQYQSDLASTEEWKNHFVSMFLKNSRYGSGYFYSVCEENDDILTLEQVEYINYSITGEYVDFSDVIEGSIDCSECSSFWNSAQIDDYQVTKQGDRIVIDAKIGIYNDGEVVPHIQLNSQIILVRNQYSFLDGYSINQITSEEIVIYSDGKEHTFVGCVALEEDDYFILEVGQTENDIPYGHFVKVYTEDNPEIAEYIRANESEYFTVTFIWENMTGPIEEVVPTKVEIADIFIDE